MTGKDRIRQRLEAVRETTLSLLAKVPEEFLARRVHSFYSPVGWHFGHVGRTEDYWVMVRALGQPPLDADLDFLYTDRVDNPKDNRVHVPDRQTTIAYLAATRRRSLAALEEADFASNDPFLRDGYGWEFAIQHECQHQETICEMLHLIQAQLPMQVVAPMVPSIPSGPSFVDLAGGTFVMGTDDPMAYDNEQMSHEVEVAPFRLAKDPVTAAEWLAFMEAGCYRRPSLWSEEGWDWVCKGGITAPEYWRTVPGGWASLGMFGMRRLEPDEPVMGVSHFEAAAYARWVGARLPSEPEWEFAASEGVYPWGDATPTAEHANFGMGLGHPISRGSFPKGTTRDGISGMAGDVWEWTSSPFLPYPGFVAFPYDGYSKDHMKGEHRVCRGGSWATAGPILRRTFRNWYVPSYRQGFLGVRLASTL